MFDIADGARDSAFVGGVFVLPQLEMEN